MSTSANDVVMCSERVYDKISKGFSQCRYKGKVVRNGKQYCGLHDPVKIEEKDAAKQARWEIEWEADRKKYALRAAGPGLLEACKAALTLHLWEAGAHNQTIIWQIEAAIAKAEGEK